MTARGKTAKKGEREQQREDLFVWCQEHLKPGVHFSTIHKKVGGRDNKRWCHNYGKHSWDACSDCGALPGLRQPGAERIAYHLGLRFSDPQVAQDIITAYGGSGWMAIRLEAIDTETGEVKGHGVGAHKHMDPNTATKFATKNAMIDLLRRAYALSDWFDDADGDDDVQPPADAPRGSERRQQPPPKDKKPPTPARSAKPAGDPRTENHDPEISAEELDRQTGAPEPPRDKTTTPARPPSGRRGMPTNQATGQKKDPPWWKIGEDIAGAVVTVVDRDDNEYGVQGCLHYPASSKPELGQQKKWSPFTPNASGKPEFKTKEPFTEWAPMTWFELLEYAVSHRAKRPKADDTNHYNDPFHHLLGDRYVCVYQGAVLPIAEQAAACDMIAWRLVMKKNPDAPIPDWVLKAINGDAPAPVDEQAQAPADARDDSFDLDHSEDPFA